VESYSKYYGVSFEETLYRFHIQDIAGELDAKLSENEANTFAGLWIEHTPKFKIVILFTQGGGENIDAYLTEELASLINVRPAKMSLIELQNAQKEAVASLWNIKILAGSEINVYENTIKVFIEEADKTRLDIALRHKSLIIPDYIKIITVTKLGGTV